VIAVELTAAQEGLWSLPMDGRADFFRKEFVLGFYCDRRSRLGSPGLERSATADAVARAIERGDVFVIWY
jgi:hypothetical protein